MIGWLDCSSGVAGDMLLGALVDVGVPVAVLQQAIDAVAPEPVRLRAEDVSRSGLRACRVHVEVTDRATHRTWREVRDLLARADLDSAVRNVAITAFTQLAEAEARVHGGVADDVHFHEVGALDAIADVVGCAAGLNALRLDSLHSSPVAVGSGTVQTQHGTLPVPVPAVVELLRDAPSYGGDIPMELTTPTGAALCTTAATAWSSQPPMSVRSYGAGAGSRDVEGRPNVVRLLVGEPSPALTQQDTELVLETNVDDMDPRLWPAVLARLLDAGASDAWLVPILMKKGRPAHTLCVLVSTHLADAVRHVILSETTTIGIRAIEVTKTAMQRRSETVHVDGQPIRVKLALLDGRVVNAQPEYDDIATAAKMSGRPVRAVLDDAKAAARTVGVQTTS